MAENHAVRHETTDANVKGILWFGAALIALCLVSWLAVAVTYHLLHDTQIKEKKARFPLAKEELPPEPRLEEIDRELGKGKKSLVPSVTGEEDQYRWIDKEKGIVQIPIEAAMSKLIKAGKLKARKNGKAPVIPTDANPGRK